MVRKHTYMYVSLYRSTGAALHVSQVRILFLTRNLFSGYAFHKATIFKTYFLYLFLNVLSANSLR